jgi:hypothetical protein
MTTTSQVWLILWFNPEVHGRSLTIKIIFYYSESGVRIQERNVLCSFSWIMTPE